MKTEWLIIIGIFWYISGIVSFIYWWTKEWDFTSKELMLALFVGIMGPLAFLFGFLDNLGDNILIKQQKNDSNIN